LCIRDKTNVCFYQVSFSFENKVSNFVFFLVELLLLRLFPPYLNCSLNTAGCNKINAGDGDCVWCSGGIARPQRKQIPRFPSARHFDTVSRVCTLCNMNRVDDTTRHALI
jgi:hypothetical protein